MRCCSDWLSVHKLPVGLCQLQSVAAEAKVVSYCHVEKTLIEYKLLKLLCIGNKE